jgi:hypothetical protein
MSSRSEGTNPRAQGTNPRGPRTPTREERIDADLARRQRAAEILYAENAEREAEIMADPDVIPMPENMRDMLRNPPLREDV